MGLQFAVDNWAGLAPGLATHEEWLEWFRQPRALTGDFTSELTWVPTALRRRLSPLGRTALNVLALCQPREPCPIVFAWRYGDLEGIAGLLAQLCREGVVSPAGFSLSVHNAPAGVYCIAREDRVGVTSIAANADLAEVACCEALGWLGAGFGQVLMVCCGDPIPRPYVPTAGAEAFRYAWACRLRAVHSGGLSLRSIQDRQPYRPAAAVHSASLRALAFLASAQQRELLSDTGRYLWQRHD